MSDIMDVLQARMKEARRRHAIVSTEGNSIHCELCFARGKRLLYPCPSLDSIKSMNIPYEEAEMLLKYVNELIGKSAYYYMTLKEAQAILTSAMEALDAATNGGKDV